MSTLFKIIHLILVISFSMAACKEMDDNYQQYVVPDGITYPGKANHAVLHPGRERVLITWPAGADPSVVKAHVYWNNYSDSIVLDIPSGTDTVRCHIDPLPEGSYSFIIHTFDTKGNISIPVELNGFVYGELYQSSISQRLVKDFSLDLGSGKYLISWNDADITNGAWSTEVKYKNLNGTDIVLIKEATKDTTLISDIDLYEPFFYRTMYMPDSVSIDAFYTDYLEYTIDEIALPKDRMKILAFSSQHSGTANQASNILDGNNTGTRWHTNASGGNFPHFITIDFGGVAPLTRITVWSSLVDRPANSPDPRHPKQFKIETSQDNETWTEIATYDFRNVLEQDILIPLTYARYIRLTGEQPSSYNGTTNIMALGELSFYCK
ncbi:MAG: discoidin domain-containing protein [Bacteroidales bacterium]|nr:discoidin domain-containing protein [Bacteroidales bacterium]